MIAIRCGDKIFSNLQAVIFDKDGTLEDSNNFGLALARLRARLIDERVPGTGESLLAMFGVLDDGTLARQGLMAVGSRMENIIAAAAYITAMGFSWEKSVAIAREAVTEADNQLIRTSDNAALFPGTLALLQRLKAAGLKLGILSAAAPERVSGFVVRHELSSYFQLEMGVTARGPFKPDPALFWEACTLLEVEAEKTLMVGDSSLDMLMAKQAGAAGAVAICWQGGTLDYADVAIANFEQDAIDLLD